MPGDVALDRPKLVVGAWNYPLITSVLFIIGREQAKGSSLLHTVSVSQRLFSSTEAYCQTQTPDLEYSIVLYNC